MIRSMTAFGRGEFTCGSHQLVVEIRSLNNRYRDIILKLPRNFQFLEEEVRASLAKRIARGRVEVTVQSLGNGEERPSRLELNIPMVKAYLGIFDRLAEDFGMRRDVRMDQFCLLSEVILRKPEEIDEEALRSALGEALDKGLEALEGMRAREGDAIAADFRSRLGCLASYADAVALRAPQVVEAYRLRLAENIRRLLGDGDCDQTRLTQETALFAERSDITEELVRLRSHLQQFTAYLEGDEAVGRRLDFLLQEMHREVNTLSAKSSDSDISKMVVEMKAELEKIREQVQNVE